MVTDQRQLAKYRDFTYYQQEKHFPLGQKVLAPVFQPP